MPGSCRVNTGNHKIILSCTVKSRLYNTVNLFDSVVSPKFDVNNMSGTVAKSSDNLMVGAIPIFKTKSIVIISFTIIVFKSLVLRNHITPLFETFEKATHGLGLPSRTI